MKTLAIRFAENYDSRRKRRDAIKTVIACVSAISAAEQMYLENVPENLQGSESFEVGENAVDALDEIIDLLTEVY